MVILLIMSPRGSAQSKTYIPGTSPAYLCYSNKTLETGFFIIKKEIYSLEVLETRKSKTKTGLWHLRERPRMLSVPMWQNKGTLHVPQGPCIRVTSHPYRGWSVNCCEGPRGSSTSVPGSFVLNDVHEG